MQADREVPVSLRRLDLGFSFAALQEQPPGCWPEERAGELEKTWAWRKRPRAHHVRSKALGAFGEVFNAHRVNVHSGLRLAGDLGEERAFFPVALDEMHAEIRPPGFEDRNHQPGKTCP